MTTTVVHCKKEPFDVYIGRPSKWGNPFAIGTHGTRSEVIELYRQYILKQPGLMAALPELKDKVLGCYCAPQACHGDVLAYLADGGEMEAKGVIDDFKGKYRFLSNFSIHPAHGYPTNEHFYQAMKVDRDQPRAGLYRQMLKDPAMKPGRAKRLGQAKKMAEFGVHLREGWEEGLKDQVMLSGLQSKFSDPKLAKLLLATDGFVLIEGNWWHDTYWGTCDGKRCEYKHDRPEGQNMLGKMLMDLRESLKKAE